MPLILLPLIGGIAIGAGGTLALSDNVKSAAIMATLAYMAFKVIK